MYVHNYMYNLKVTFVDNIKNIDNKNVKQSNKIQYTNLTNSGDFLAFSQIYKL